MVSINGFNDLNSIKRRPIKSILFAILIIYLTLTLGAATNVHYEYEWWGSAREPLPGKFASCPACHERLGGVSSVRKNCEDCHVPGKTGAFQFYEPAGLILKDTYSAPKVYYHISSMSNTTHIYRYQGEEIVVGDQSEKFSGSTTSTCFGFNPETGEGTCHGISNKYPVDGYFAFNWTKDVTGRWPHEYALSSSSNNLPDTKNCKYCHTQSDSTIIDAWGGPTQTSDHKEATTNEDCHGCHVTGGIDLNTFHVMGPEPEVIAIQKSPTGVNTWEIGGGGGVGGGGGGSPSPRSLLPEGSNELTASTYNNILLSLSSSGKINKDRFVEVENTLAASMILNKRYPMPTYSVASDFPRTIEKITADVYTITAAQTKENIRFIYEPHKDEIVIARGDLGVDSMAALAYANTKNVPILHVKPDELPGVTEGAIDHFLEIGKREIIIIGGPVAVSKEVEEQLRKKAFISRIYGETRIDTALALARRAYPQAVKVRSIVITDYENPVIDAALMSYALDAPLLYVKSDSLSPQVKEYLVEHKETIFGRTKVVLLGVNPKVASEINEILIQATP